jgi:hypothetical protein
MFNRQKLGEPLIKSRALATFLRRIQCCCLDLQSGISRFATVQFTHIDTTSGFGQTEPSTIDLTVINACAERRHDSFVAIHNVVVDGPPRMLLDRIVSHLKADCYKVISLSIGGPQDNYRATCVAVISSTLSRTKLRRRGF